MVLQFLEMGPFLREFSPLLESFLDFKNLNFFLEIFAKKQSSLFSLVSAMQICLNYQANLEIYENIYIVHCKLCFELK